MFRAVIAALIAVGLPVGGLTIWAHLPVLVTLSDVSDEGISISLPAHDESMAPGSSVVFWPMPREVMVRDARTGSRAFCGYAHWLYRRVQVEAVRQPTGVACSINYSVLLQ